MCENDPIELPEGGEVRLEIIRRQEGLGYEVRTTAWFASAQVPASREFVRNPADWQRTLANPCTDMRDRKKFPNGVPDSRTYLDAGPTVTLGSALTLEKATNLQDYSFHNVFDIGYIAMPDPESVDYGTEYTAQLAGGGELPAMSVTDTRKLYLPPDYTVTFPDFENGVEIEPGEELPVLWTDTAPENDPYLYGFVTFGDGLGLQYLCIGPNTGVMKIPSEVIADLTPTGFIQHGILSHRPVAITGTSTPLDGKRIDLIGISCTESRYNVRRQ